MGLREFIQTHIGVLCLSDAVRRSAPALPLHIFHFGTFLFFLFLLFFQQVVEPLSILFQSTNVNEKRSKGLHTLFRVQQKLFGSSPEAKTCLSLGGFHLNILVFRTLGETYRKSLCMVHVCFWPADTECNTPDHTTHLNTHTHTQYDTAQTLPLHDTTRTAQGSDRLLSFCAGDFLSAPL